MKRKTNLIALIVFAATILANGICNAQSVGINNTGASANSSAMLDVSSTNKGMLVPRMTNSQRNAISSPANGLLIYQIDATAGFYYYNGTTWQAIAGGGSSQWTTAGSNIFNANTGYVGIGTTTPAARLHVADSSVVFTSAGIAETPGNPPVSGEGSRMMWYVDKIAFRAGTALGDGWDNANTGYNSIGLGYGPIASGTNSMAFGTGTASALEAISIGTGSATNTNAIAIRGNATGENSFAVHGGQASGEFAFAQGQDVIASGIHSIALGNQTNATALQSVAIGYTTNANGYNSFAANGGTASNSFSIAIGRNASALESSAMALGEDAYASGLHAVGIGGMGAATGGFAISLGGTASGEQSVAIGGTASGSYSHSLGGTASGENANAIGNGVSASGTGSLAMGYQTTASGNYSTAMGHSSIASGLYSTAIGGGSIIVAAPLASGNYSTAIGFNTIASGDYSTSMGSSVSTNGQPGSFAIGDLSLSTEPTSVTSNDAANQMMMRFGGGYKLYSNSDATLGLHITSSGVAKYLTDVSSSFDDLSLVNKAYVDGAVSGGGWVTSGSDIHNSNTGKVGIGTSSPEAKLHVNGNAIIGSGYAGSNSVAIGGFADGVNSVSIYGYSAAENAVAVLGGNAYGISSLAMSGGYTTGASSTAISNGTASGENATAISGGTASGYRSTAIGYGSGSSNDNTFSIGNGTNASGLKSIAIGNDGSSSGFQSISIGSQSSATGTQSISIGYYNYATGSTATSMGVATVASGNGAMTTGYYTEASGEYSTAMGVKVSTNSKTGSFIVGDNSSPELLGTITTFNDADNQMMMRFAGGYKLYSDASATVGAQMGAGANSWSTISDFRKKENFSPVDGEAFLKKIAKFNLTSWNYKGQDAKSFRHYGPMAQDFYAAFGKDSYGTVGNDTTINQADMEGVSFVAIQALVQRTEELQKENAALKALVLSQSTENKQLKAELTAQNDNIVKSIDELRAEINKGKVGMK